MPDAAQSIVAVTGASGFIGNAVARLLAASGWQVRVLMRPSSATPIRTAAGIEQVTGSLEASASLERLVEGAFAVVHCAGAVRGVTRADFNRVNVDGLMRLTEAAILQTPPPRFLLMSSLAAREPTLSPYAASKRRGEEVLASAAKNLPWTIFRPPAVYGPGDTELLPLFRLMARGIAPRPGMRSGRFSLLFVEDLTEAVLSWLRTDVPPAKILPLHDGRRGGYSWGDVADIVGSLAGRRVLQVPLPGPVLWIPALCNRLAGGIFGYAPMFTPGKLRELLHPDWVCDNREISTALGWAPAVPLAEGLERTLRGDGFKSVP